VTIATPIVLNADLLVGPSNLTLGPGSSITGAHAIDLRGEGCLTLHIASAHTGETRTGNGVPGAYTYTPGSITFAGALGSAPDTSAFRIEGGGSLILDDRTAFTGPAGGRMDDATPVHISSSFLQLTGNATTPSYEDIGTIHATGYSTITVSAPPTAGAHLNAAGLERIDRATLLFRGPNLGAPAGSGVANITFTSPPTDLVGGGGTGPEVSILPYAIGDTAATGNGRGLVTYSAATGIRMLDSTTEYATYDNATATSNVRLDSLAFNFSPRTINALLAVGFDSRLIGDAPLTITSGTLLATSNSELGVPLNFGTAEASIFVAGTSGLIIGGMVSGSGGLTKSGSGTLALSATNTFTGPLIINDGLIVLGLLESLGPDSSPIIINANGNGAGLAFNGTLIRDIEVRAGLAKIGTENFGFNTTLEGTVTGAGGLRITGSGTVTLASANFYLGPTVVEGDLAFSSDAALGNGGSLVLAGASKVRLDGPWITDRLVELRGISALDTNGFDAVLNGPLVGDPGGVLTKIGDGALTIAGPGFMGSGAVNIDGGIVRATELGRLPGVSIFTEGTLELDNSGTVLNDRLVDSTPVTFAGGALRILGHGAESVRELAGPLASSDGGTLTLLTPGSGTVEISFASYSSTGGPLVFRGQNFAGDAVGPFTRASFRTAPILVGELLPRAVVDTTATGTGDSFATYDPGFDAGGVIGVRPLRDSEYFTSSLIQNPSEGGATPTDASFRVLGPTTLGGFSATVNSVTFSGTGNLALTSGQTLAIGNAAFLTQRGGSALISGGALTFNGNRFTFLGDGDLTFGSTFGTFGTIEKYGVGVLTLLDQAKLSGPVIVHEGVLQPASGTDLSTLLMQVNSGANLDLANATVRIGVLEGSGVVTLGSGTLVIGGYYFSSGTFDGPISGTGGISVTEDMNWSLTATSSYLGPTTAYRDTAKPGNFPFNGPSISLMGDGSALTSNGYMALAARIEISNFSGVEDRIGSAPVILNGSTLRMSGHPTLASDETAGPLSVAGFSEVVVRADPLGSGGGTSTALNFTDLIRQDRGTVGIGTDDFNNIGEKARLGFSPTLQASLIGAGTTATNCGILPFMILQKNFPTGFLTFDPATGVRPLAESEYSETLTPGDNVYLRSNSSVTSPI
ncbi:MAG: autotransporter-associated beta strand repeat-containing protein, partial [Chthoniobacteraceae bacterium]